MSLGVAGCLLDGPPGCWDGFFGLFRLGQVPEHSCPTQMLCLKGSGVTLPPPAPLLHPRNAQGAFWSRQGGIVPCSQGQEESMAIFPNCFVYEALGRVSSGFPNELVCC